MPQQLVVAKNAFEKFSHELRVSTPQDLPVRATAGVFVQRQMHRIYEDYVMPGFDFTSPFGGNANGLDPALSVPGLPNTIWLTDETRVDRDKAIFAQVTWDITSQLELSGGERYFKTDNTLEGFFGYGRGFQGAAPENPNAARLERNGRRSPWAHPARTWQRGTDNGHVPTGQPDLQDRQGQDGVCHLVGRVPTGRRQSHGCSGRSALSSGLLDQL
jgi:outer membrane receptor protein involved in Fe transport